ncbi:MAG: 3-deoxy-manno-octulosonate cytidylyltransferase [Flavobacteriaceae bacterium]|nr:3-deoxy-manno-octulosonate cytidylyltransferase [Flavobacteriaceae bacterium]
MKVLGIIPARYASTRLAGKPLVDLCGKSMIQRVYERATAVLKDVVVATDDERIFTAVENFGGHVVMTAASHNTGTNRCLEAYEKYTSSEKKYDVVINIQGDEPLLEPEQIQTLIGCFEDPNTEMGTLVIPTKPGDLLEGTGVFVVFDQYQNALYFSRSVIPFVRDYPTEDWSNHHTFYRHVGMYGFRPHALKLFAGLHQTSLETAESLEQNRWLQNGKKLKVGITLKETIPVDTPQDVEKVIKILQKTEA